MKKMYALLVTVFALFCTGTAFSQDIYFSAVGARNDGNASAATSGTLTMNASPQQDGALANFATITSFQYGYENSTTLGAGGNPSTGRTQLNEIIITKNVDQSSNRLMQAGLSSVLLSSAQILITRNSATGRPPTIYKIDLKNAFITEFNASAGAGTGCTNGCVGESFKIIYSAIQVTTYTQNSTTGVYTANPPASWNQAANTATY